MPISGAFPPINEDNLGAKRSARSFLRAFVDHLADLGRAPELLATDVGDSDAVVERKRWAAVAEAVQNAHVRLDAIGPSNPVGVFSLTEGVVSPGGVVSNWEPWDDAFTTNGGIAIQLQLGSPLAITGLLPADFAGFMFTITASAQLVQIRLNDALSDEANRIGVSPASDVSPAPVYAEAESSPSNAVNVLPGQTAMLVYFGTGLGWRLLGVFGKSQHHVLPAPQLVTLSAAGLLNTVTSFAQVTATSGTAEVRAMGTTIADATEALPWQEVRVMNDTGGSLTVVHESGSVSALLRITTPTALNVTWPPGTMAVFIRDGVTNRWRLVNTPT